MDDLKPCPFCGDDAELRPIDAYNEWAAVMCTGEDCLAGVDGHSDLEDAVENWNRRAPIQDTGDSVSSVEEGLQGDLPTRGN